MTCSCSVACAIQATAKPCCGQQDKHTVKTHTILHTMKHSYFRFFISLLFLFYVGNIWGVTVHFVTDKVNPLIHYWGSNNGSSWDNCPTMQKGAAVTINNATYYDYSYEIGNNTGCIFRDKDGNKYTGDLTIDGTKLYYYNSAWYASLESIPGYSGGSSGGSSSGDTDTRWMLRGTIPGVGWSADNVVFTQDPDAPAEKKGSLTVSITQTGTYEFKVVGRTNGSDDWYGYNGTITADNCNSIAFGNAGNAKIDMNVVGTYTFVIDYSDGSAPKVSVVYPSTKYTLTLHANGGSTNGSATVTYGAIAATDIKSPTRAGYTLLGFYAEEECTKLVMNVDGTLVNADGYVANGSWCRKENTTLYAKWQEIVRSGITLYVRSQDGGVMMESNLYKNGTLVRNITGQRIEDEADCAYEQWWLVNFSDADAMQQLYIWNNSGCDRNQSPFALSGEGDYWFDCSGSNTVQVTTDWFCPAPEVTLYVYSADWNGYTPKIKYQSRTTGGDYGAVSEKEMVSMQADGCDSRWYKCVFDEENLKTVQVELLLCKNNSCRPHKVNNNWYTISAGTSVYWDITDGCGDNEKAPVATQDRPCQEQRTYSVTYDANGGNTAAPAALSKPQRATFSVADYTGTKEGYEFGGWNDGCKVYQAGDTYTMPAKNVKFTAVWNRKATTAWALLGSKLGGWDKSGGISFDRYYRGQENVFYCVTKLSNMNDWFKITDRTDYYSCTSQNANVTESLAYFSKTNAQTLYANNHGSGGAMKISDATDDKNVWVVLDVPNRKFWVENIAVLFDVLVTHETGDAAGSTYSLKNANAVEAQQFAAGESYELTILPADGYRPIVTVDGVEVNLTLKNTVTDTRSNTAVYTYIGPMDNANQTVTIRYEKLAPIRIFVHLDKGLNTYDGWDWSNAAPLIQWNATSLAEGWTGFNDNTRLSRLPGFENWFEFTFAGQTVLTWQLRDAASAGNGHYSGQQQITTYDESFCYRIDDYKMPDYDNQMRISRFDCPDAGVRLQVNGGTMVGSVAELSSNHNLNTDWAGGEITTAYTYRYNGGNWQSVPANNEVLVTGAGTYTYKVTVTISKDGTPLYEDYATQTIVVEKPAITLTPSTTAATAGQQITATVTLDKVANTKYSYIVMSLWSGKDKLDIEFTQTKENEYTFNMPAADGTYTLRAEFKVGATVEQAVLITYAETGIRIGSMIATLTITPEAPKVGDKVTLTVQPVGSLGTTYYTYTVKALTTPTVRVLATNTPTNTCTFDIPSEDSYIFTVIVRDDNHEVTLTQTVSVSGKDMYIHYPFTGPTDWPTYPMTYKGEGIYVYYSAESGKESIFYGEKVGDNPLNAAYIGTGNTASTDGKQQYVGQVMGNPSKGDIVTFVFDNNSKKLYIYADKTMRRLKSVTDYGIFYSNVRGDAGPVSFFATSSGTQYMQTFVNGDWQDVAEPSSLVTADGIFTATMNADGSVTGVAPYTGDLTLYYLNGKPRNYLGDAGKMVDFSNVSTTYYDHYHMEWTGKTSKEIGATVGNNINHNIANILAEYTAPSDCNARYEYNSATNKLSRTTIAGVEDKFLTIYGDGMTTTNGNSLTRDNPLTLTDGTDWLYTAELKVVKADGSNSGIRGYLMAEYNNEKCWLLAASGLETASDASLPVIGSATAAGTYNIILMYDYKTNRITAGWKPTGTVTVDDELVVDANILFVREENNDVAQIVLNTDDSRIAGLQKVVFVMQLTSKTATSGESHYKFSLPFDCHIKDIYGLPETYLNSWGIQRYNGAERARTGWFEEDRATFWEWMNYNETLRAGEGYSLSVDRSVLGNWYANKYLYFPSSEEGFEMSKTGFDTKVEYPNQPCNVNLQYPDDPNDEAHRDRRKYDSNWKLIGPKNYNNIKIRVSEIEWDDNYYLQKDVPSYVYELDSANTKYLPNSTTDFQFHAFFSYFVQFAGTIVWEQYTQSQHTALSAPRRVQTFSRRPADFRIELRDLDDNEIDRTFVSLSAQGTEGFDLNLDLTKIAANRPQIYTVSEHTHYAGNTMPLATDTVALSVDAPAGGIYAITMPHENGNYDVLLVDKFEQQANALSAEGCRVQLAKGTTADRFCLVFSPRAQPSQPEGPSTDMKPVGNAAAAQKVFINGVIYILRGNRIYDLNGRMVTL